MNIKYSTAKTIWRIYTSEGRVEKKRQRHVLSEAALRNRFLMECLSGKMGAMALFPVDLFLTGSSIGPSFWADQITNHINNS